MRSGLTVVWGCRMLTGSVLATFWGISRIFSAMKPWTAFSASTVPWIRHTRSVVPASTKSWSEWSGFLKIPQSASTMAQRRHSKAILQNQQYLHEQTNALRDFQKMTYRWWIWRCSLCRSYKLSSPIWKMSANIVSVCRVSELLRLE